MQVNTEQKPYDTINVTPMLDLAYVLLVVFILMTTASVQGLTIAVPKPSSKPSTEQHELIVLQVMQGGTLMANGAPVTLAELEPRLQAAKSRDPQMSVAIKGEAGAQYGGVISVVDLCNRLGVNMAFITGRFGT